jgi:hypothetical protein
VKHHLQRCANAIAHLWRRASPSAEFFSQAASPRSKSNTRNTIFFSTCYVSREHRPKVRNCAVCTLGARASGIFWPSLKACGASAARGSEPSGRRTWRWRWRQSSRDETETPRGSKRATDSPCPCYFWAALVRKSLCDNEKRFVGKSRGHMSGVYPGARFLRSRADLSALALVARVTGTRQEGPLHHQSPSCRPRFLPAQGRQIPVGVNSPRRENVGKTAHRRQRRRS